MKTPIRLSLCLALSLTAPCVLAADKDEVQRNFIIGPDYQKAPELDPGDRVKRGEVKEFTMRSEDSRIYKGIAKGRKGTVPYKRRVAVYLPARFRSKKELPFIVVQDGMWYKDVLSKALDTLIDQKRVPVMAAIFIESGGGDAQGSQRGLEYDTVDGTYAEFVEKEVLPEVSSRYRLKLTSDPEGRATMGGSSGGAAAFTMAWFHPDLYRKVLSYSGTFVNQQWPESRKTPHGAWEYHENLIRRSAKKPIKVWLEVSEKDNGWDKDEASLHNWVMANERMAEQLERKGYDYRYVFARNAGHTDGKVTAQTLPGALEWLWQDYQEK